jgi:hypothetical protein
MQLLMRHKRREKAPSRRARHRTKYCIAPNSATAAMLALCASLQISRYQPDKGPEDDCPRHSPGTPESHRSPRQRIRDVPAALRALPADVFALYVKTKNFHWHMSSSHFRDYHLMLDEQSDEIFATTDDIAERARKIGGTAIRSTGQVARHILNREKCGPAMGRSKHEQPVTGNSREPAKPNGCCCGNLASG